MAVALGELVARLRLDSSGFAAGMTGVQSSLGRAGSAMSNVGGKLTRGVTLPLAAAAGAGIKLAADFDTTMRQVGIATGGARAKLQDLALEMGAKTSFSAGEAADAMLELAKSGMTAAQIEGGGLAATMKLASAGGVDLASSAGYVSNAMAAFGLKAKDAESVTVALAGGANASSASVESLGQGLSQVAAGARTSGLSLQQTVGVLSAFDAQGIKGSDAGTSLKTMLDRLIPSTAKAKNAMKDLGLDFVKADGSFVSIGNVAEQLQNKLGKLGEAERKKALATIFGSDASRAANALMNMGAEGVAKYTKAARDQATTNKLAGAAMKGTAGAVDRAKGSIETAGIALGMALAPSVQKIAAVVEKLANKFAGLSPQTRDLVVKFLAVAAAVGPLLIMFGKMATGASAVVGGVKTIGSGISGIGTAASKAKTGFTNFRAGMSSTQAASSAFTGKMGTLGGAVKSAGTRIGTAFSSAASGIATGVGKMASATGRGISAAATWATSTAKSAARGAAAMVKAGIRIAATWAMMAARALAAAARMAAAWLISLGPIGILIAAVVGAAALIIANWNKVKGFLVKVWNAIKSAAASVWGGIKAVVVRVVQGIVAVFRTVVRVYVTIFKTAWNAIKSAASAVWNAIKAVVTAGVNAIKTVVSNVVNGIKSLWSRVWNGIKAVVSTVWSGIKSVVSNAISGVKTVISNGIDGAKTVMSNAWSAIKSAVSSAWSGIKGAVSTGIGNVVSTVTSLPGKIKSALSGAASWLVSIGKDVIQGLMNGIGSMAGAIVDKIKGVVDGAISGAKNLLGIGSPSKVFKRIGRWVGDGLIEGMTGSMDDVAEASEKLASKVETAFQARANAADARQRQRHRRELQAFEGTEKQKDRLRERFEAQEERASTRRENRIARHVRNTMNSFDREIANIKRNARAREELAERVKKAEDKVRAAIKARADFAKEVASTAIGTGSVVAASEVEEGERLTSGSIIANMRDRLAALQRFRDQLALLKKRGLNADTYRELLTQGPEAAGATVTALAAGGKAAVGQINKLQGAFNTEGKALGKVGAGHLYDAGVQTARGLLRGLEKEARQMNQVARRLARTLARAVRKELGIRSPSRVFESLGRQVGAGMARGIDASSSQVQGSMRRLVAVPGGAGSPSVATAPGAAPRGGPTINVTANTNANPYEIAREIGWQMRGVA